MIRVNAKVGKILSCKISDIDLFNASLSLVDLSEEICSNPECKAKGCCRAHASYTRDIISFYHGKRQESQVVIPRVYCESCGKTHALIPNHLIPYGRKTRSPRMDYQKRDQSPCRRRKNTQ